MGISPGLPHGKQGKQVTGINIIGGITMDQDLASRQEARELGKQAEEAQRSFCTFSQEKLDAIVQAVSQAFLSSAGELGRMAWEERGLAPPRTKKSKIALRPSGFGRPSGTSGPWAFSGGPGAKGLGWGVPVGSLPPLFPPPIPPPPCVIRP